MKVELNESELEQMLEANRDLHNVITDLRVEIALLLQEKAALLKPTAPPASFEDPQASNRETIMQVVSSVVMLTTSEQKLAAIKLLREVARCGLKEAKDAVEGNYTHYRG